MLFRFVSIEADEAIVDRFPSGSYVAFSNLALCVTEHYSVCISKQFRTRDTNGVGLRFSENVVVPPTTWGVHNVPWRFDFKRFFQTTDLFDRKSQILSSLQEGLL